MTEREIRQRVDRMTCHLDRLLLNRDISDDDYDAAIRDLAEWEEAAMMKLADAKGEAE
jgi:NAD-dependent DNA ligase